MATTEQPVTSTPTVISTISPGSSYSVQNSGNSRIIHVAEAAAVPAAGDASHILEYADWVVVTLPPGELAYVWTSMGDGIISVTEVTT